MAAHARRACRSPSPLQPLAPLLLLALVPAAAWAAPVAASAAGFSRAARCPCLPTALCPHAFGSSPDDARLLGRQPRCPPLARSADTSPARALVRCCAASTRAERGGVTLTTHRSSKLAGPVDAKKPEISVSSRASVLPSPPPPLSSSPPTTPATPAVTKANSETPTASTTFATPSPIVSSTASTPSTGAPLVSSPAPSSTPEPTADPTFSTTPEPPRPVYIPQPAQPSIRSVSTSDTSESLVSTKLEILRSELPRDIDHVASKDDESEDKVSVEPSTHMPITTLISIANDSLISEFETTTQITETLATESALIPFDDPGHTESFNSSFSDSTTTDISTTEYSTSLAATEKESTHTPVTLSSDTRSPAVDEINTESTTANIEDYPRTELSDVGTTTEYLHDNSTYELIQETTTDIMISSSLKDNPSVELVTENIPDEKKQNDSSMVPTTLTPDAKIKTNLISYDTNQENSAHAENLLHEISTTTETIESSTRELEIEIEMTTSKYVGTENEYFQNGPMATVDIETNNLDPSRKIQIGESLLLNGANNNTKEFHNKSNNLPENDIADRTKTNQQTLEFGILNVTRETNDSIAVNSTADEMFQTEVLQNKTEIKENNTSIGRDGREYKINTNEAENDNSVSTIVPNTMTENPEQTFTDTPTTEENFTSNGADTDTITTESPSTTEAMDDVVTNAPQPRLSPEGDPAPLEEEEETGHVGRKTARRLRPFLIVEDDLENPPHIKEEHEDNAVDPLQEFVKLLLPKAAPTLPPPPPSPPTSRRRPPAPRRPPRPTCPPSVLRSTQHSPTEPSSTAASQDGLVVVLPSPPENSTPETDVLLVYPCSTSNVPVEEENMTIVFADTLGGINDLYTTTEENKNTLDALRQNENMSELGSDIQQKHAVPKDFSENGIENYLDSLDETNYLLSNSDESHSISASEHIHQVLSPEVSPTDANDDPTTTTPIPEPKKRINSPSRSQPVPLSEIKDQKATSRFTGLFGRRPRPNLLRSNNSESTTMVTSTTMEAIVSTTQSQRKRPHFLKPLHIRPKISMVHSTPLPVGSSSLSPEISSTSRPNFQDHHLLPHTTTASPISGKETIGNESSIHPIDVAKTTESHITARPQNFVPLPLTHSTTMRTTTFQPTHSTSSPSPQISMGSNLNRENLHSHKSPGNLPIATTPVPTTLSPSAHSLVTAVSTSDPSVITTTARPGIRFRHPPPASALLSKINSTKESLNTKEAAPVVPLRKVVKVFKRPLRTTTTTATPHHPTTSAAPLESSSRPPPRRPPSPPLPAAAADEDVSEAEQVPLAIRVRGEYPFVRVIAPQPPLLASPAQVQEAQTLNGIVTAEGALAKHLVQVIAGLRRLTLGQRHDAVSSTISTPPATQRTPTLGTATSNMRSTTNNKPRSAPIATSHTNLSAALPAESSSIVHVALPEGSSTASPTPLATLQLDPIASHSAPNAVFAVAPPEESSTQTSTVDPSLSSSNPINYTKPRDHVFVLSNASTTPSSSNNSSDVEIITTTTSTPKPPVRTPTLRSVLTSTVPSIISKDLEATTATSATNTQIIPHKKFYKRIPIRRLPTTTISSSKVLNDSENTNTRINENSPASIETTERSTPVPVIHKLNTDNNLITLSTPSPTSVSSKEHSRATSNPPTAAGIKFGERLRARLPNKLQHHSASSRVQTPVRELDSEVQNNSEKQALEVKGVGVSKYVTRPWQRRRPTSRVASTSPSSTPRTSFPSALTTPSPLTSTIPSPLTPTSIDIEDTFESKLVTMPSTTARTFSTKNRIISGAFHPRGSASFKRNSPHSSLISSSTSAPTTSHPPSTESFPFLRMPPTTPLSTELSSSTVPTLQKPVLKPFLPLQPVKIIPKNKTSHFSDLMKRLPFFSKFVSTETPHSTSSSEQLQVASNSPKTILYVGHTTVPPFPQTFSFLTSTKLSPQAVGFNYIDPENSVTSVESSTSKYKYIPLHYINSPSANPLPHSPLVTTRSSIDPQLLHSPTTFRPVTYDSQPELISHPRAPPTQASTPSLPSHQLGSNAPHLLPLNHQLLAQTAPPGANIWQNSPLISTHISSHHPSSFTVTSRLPPTQPHQTSHIAPPTHQSSVPLSASGQEHRPFWSLISNVPHPANKLSPQPRELIQINRPGAERVPTLQTPLSSSSLTQTLLPHTSNAIRRPTANDPLQFSPSELIKIDVPDVNTATISRPSNLLHPISPANIKGPVVGEIKSSLQTYNARMPSHHFPQNWINANTDLKQVQVSDQNQNQISQSVPYVWYNYHQDQPTNNKEQTSGQGSSLRWLWGLL